MGKNYLLTRLHTMNHRAKVKNSIGIITIDELYILIDKNNDFCKLCGKYLYRYCFDHIIPISRGGMNIIKNIQILCYECNRQKSYR